MMKNVLLSSAVAILLLSGCNETKEEPKKELTQKTEVKSVENTTDKNIEIIKEKSSEILNSSKVIVEAVKEESVKLIDSSKEITKDVVEKAKDVSVVVAKEAKEITNSVANDINKTMDSVIETKKESTVDAQKLYMKCAGCHGQSGELHALGKSQIIKEWDKNKIKEALIGYKNGTYGGNMKGVMIGQVMNLSETDIDALATYIDNF